MGTPKLDYTALLIASASCALCSSYMWFVLCADPAAACCLLLSWEMRIREGFMLPLAAPLPSLQIVFVIRSPHSLSIVLGIVVHLQCRRRDERRPWPLAWMQRKGRQGQGCYQRLWLHPQSRYPRTVPSPQDWTEKFEVVYFTNNQSALAHRYRLCLIIFRSLLWRHFIDLCRSSLSTYFAVCSH